MLAVKSFSAARVARQGIERRHMIKKARMITVDGPDLSAAERFYSLAA